MCKLKANKLSKLANSRLHFYIWIFWDDICDTPARTFWGCYKKEHVSTLIHLERVNISTYLPWKTVFCAQNDFKCNVFPELPQPDFPSKHQSLSISLQQGCGSGSRLTASGSDSRKKNLDPDPNLMKNRIRPHEKTGSDLFDKPPAPDTCLYRIRIRNPALQIAVDRGINRREQKNDNIQLFQWK